MLTGFNNKRDHGKTLMEEDKKLFEKNEAFFAAAAAMDPNYPATKEIEEFGKGQKVPTVVAITGPEVPEYKENNKLNAKAVDNIEVSPKEEKKKGLSNK